jgi:hypothetical protein
MTSCRPDGVGTRCEEPIRIDAPPGHRYTFQYRVRDDLGATSDWKSFPSSFMVAPCAAAPCSGYGLAWDPCRSGTDCLSGACIAWTGTRPGPGWHSDFVCAPCTAGACPGGGLPLDACSSDADCVGRRCDVTSGLPGWCTGTVGARCSARRCEDPSLPTCRVTSPAAYECTAG